VITRAKRIILIVLSSFNDVEPAEIPTKGRVPVRSRRCYDAMRARGVVSANDVAVKAMRDKALDLIAEAKLGLVSPSASLPRCITSGAWQGRANR
jgi:hypothetical protein